MQPWRDFLLRSPSHLPYSGKQGVPAIDINMEYKKMSTYHLHAVKLYLSFLNLLLLQRYSETKKRMGTIPYKLFHVPLSFVQMTMLTILSLPFASPFPSTITAW
jgi:hypothetical protein